jgi:isopentenyl-diphosphate delta-isomerase
MAIMIPAWVEGKLQPVEKLAAHQRGLKHKAVSVFVLRGSDILIQQRALGKYHTPGFWANTCCTHPEWDEDAADCAPRRLEEELGITGLSLEHRGQVEYRADVGNGLIEHEVVEVFVGHAPVDMPLRANPDEVMATQWVPHHDLVAQIGQRPARFTPWLRIYLASHAEMIFGDIATL